MDLHFTAAVWQPMQPVCASGNDFFVSRHSAARFAYGVFGRSDSILSKNWPRGPDCRGGCSCPRFRIAVRREGAGRGARAARFAGYRRARSRRQLFRASFCQFGISFVNAASGRHQHGSSRNPDADIVRFERNRIIHLLLSAGKEFRALSACRRIEMRFERAS